MALLNGFFLKGAASLLTAFMGIMTLYYSNDYLNNQLTKYDRGLIDFLESGGRVKFKVEKVEIDGTSQELTNEFPKFENGVVAPIIISVSTSTEEGKNLLLLPEDDSTKQEEINGLKKLLKEKKQNLRNMNGGKNSPRDWTWKCLIKLHRSGENVDGINELIKHQRQVLKWEAGEEKGNHFLDHLADSKPNENNGRKIKFIKDCGHTRSVKVNRKINSYRSLDSDHYYIIAKDEIETKKIFQLVKIKNHSDPNNLLIFKHWREFDHWFENLDN